MPLPHLLDAVERLPAFARLLNSAPGPRERLRVAGLAGSSDAAVIAAFARRQVGRFLVVATDSLPDAERWLADLRTLLDGDVVALYPPREGFGEAEPHVEVAGERVETLERTMRGEVRILVTTSRALLERTRMPRALQDLRVELRKGDQRPLRALIAHLERIGLERVPMVEDVAQFSVRGGILDVYGFGMADPVRAEFSSDEIIDLRQFDMTTQRSTREVPVVLVLPVDGGDFGELSGERRTIATLWTPDTLLVLPEGTHLEPEILRTWGEAEHHVDLARRRGEDAPDRAELFESPQALLSLVAAFGTVECGAAADAADVVFPIRAPEQVGRDIAQLRRLVRDELSTVILCDNAGQAERLDELLADFGVPSPAALTVGVLHAGFVIPGPDGGGLRMLTDHEIFRRERRIRRARRYTSSIGVETLSLKAGDYVVHLEHGVGIYRGIVTITVGESTVEVAVIEYEGGDRLNVPLYRIDQLERYRAAADVSDDAPPPRLHTLGGKRWSQQREKTRAAIREMTVELLELYARRKVASRPPHVPDTPWQQQLESSFLFEDTPDQRKATVDV